MTQFSKELNKRITPAYVGKFKLSYHPFSSQFNSNLYFETEGRKIISKKVAHLLDFTNLILFIQGASGLGKTTLIRQRIRHAKKNWRTCFVNAIDITTPQALMAKIATNMDMKLIQSVEAQSLQEQLGAMQQSGLNPILFIDDIEKLNGSLIPTLLSLIQHSKNTKPNIRLVISGQDIPSSLMDIIPQGDANRVLKYVPLPPLTEIECTEYIKHRLRTSGYDFAEPFNKNQLKKIYLDAKGFPIIVNQLADHVFAQYTLDYENKKPVLNFNEKTNNLLKYVAGGLATLVFAFVLHSAFDSTNEKQQDRITDQKVKKIEIPTVFEKNTETLALATPPEKTNNLESKKRPATEQKVKITEQKVKPKVETKPKSKPKNTAWIRAKNPKHYTLQLTSGSNRKAVQKFIKVHKLQKHAAIFHSIRNNRNWYSVIYKSFTSSKAANNAIKSLPKPLRRMKPWPRSFAAIQNSLQ